MPIVMGYDPPRREPEYIALDDAHDGMIGTHFVGDTRLVDPAPTQRHEQVSFGDGWDRPAYDARPTRQEWSVGHRPEEGDWMADHPNGLRFNATDRAPDLVNAHSGYQDPFNVELTNDRELMGGIPRWDEGYVTPFVPDTTTLI